MPLTDDTRIAASDDAVVRAVNGEAVILNLATSEYYVLDENSSSMWASMLDAGTFGAAVTTIHEAFDVPPQVLRADLAKFVDDLLAVGLVVVRDE